MEANSRSANVANNHRSPITQSGPIQRPSMQPNNALHQSGSQPGMSPYAPPPQAAASFPAPPVPLSMVPKSPNSKQKVDMLVAQIKRLYAQGLNKRDPPVMARFNTIEKLYRQAYNHAKQLAEQNVPNNHPRRVAVQQLTAYIGAVVSMQLNNSHCVGSSTTDNATNNTLKQQSESQNAALNQPQTPVQHPYSSSVPSPSTLLRLQEATETKRAAVKVKGSGIPIQSNLPVPQHNRIFLLSSSARSQSPQMQQNMADRQLYNYSLGQSTGGQTSPSQQYQSSHPPYNASPPYQQNTRYQSYQPSPLPRRHLNVNVLSQRLPGSGHIPGTDGIYRLPSATPSPVRPTPPMQQSQQTSTQASALATTASPAKPIHRYVPNPMPSIYRPPQRQQDLTNQDQRGVHTPNHIQAVVAAAARARLPPPRVPAIEPMLGKRQRAPEDTSTHTVPGKHAQQPPQKRQMLQQAGQMAQSLHSEDDIATTAKKTRPRQVLRLGGNARVSAPTTSAPANSIHTQEQVLSPPQPAQKLIRSGAAQYGQPLPYDFAEIDPRDLEADTDADIEHIWLALAKTRLQYLQITGEHVGRGDLRSSLGYNRAYNKICAMLRDWLFTYASPGADREQHHRDLSAAKALRVGRADQVSFDKGNENDIVEYAVLPSGAPLGYSEVGTRRRGSTAQRVQQRSGEQDRASEQHQQQRNKMLDGWFQGQYELVLDPKEVLFKLERWTGGIKHYVFASNVAREVCAWRDGAWTVY